MALRMDGRKIKWAKSMYLRCLRLSTWEGGIRVRKTTCDVSKRPRRPLLCFLAADPIHLTSSRDGSKVGKETKGRSLLGVDVLVYGQRARQIGSSRGATPRQRHGEGDPVTDSTTPPHSPKRKKTDKGPIEMDALTWESTQSLLPMDELESLKASNDGLKMTPSLADVLTSLTDDDVKMDSDHKSMMSSLTQSMKNVLSLGSVEPSKSTQLRSRQV